MSLQLQCIVDHSHLATILDRNQRPRGQSKTELLKLHCWYIFGLSHLALGLIYWVLLLHIFFLLELKYSTKEKHNFWSMFSRKSLVREYSGGYDLKFLQLISISPSIRAQPHFKECSCITYFRVNNVSFKSVQQVVSPDIFFSLFSRPVCGCRGLGWNGVAARLVSGPSLRLHRYSWYRTLTTWLGASEQSGRR